MVFQHIARAAGRSSSYISAFNERRMHQIRSLFLLAGLVAGTYVHAETIVLQGHYQGKNIFIQNPFSEAGVGFCVYQVTVNDKVSTDEINSSAFEVDLSIWNFRVGDPVVIKVMHKDGCSPLVLNPEVLKPKSTYVIITQEISPDGVYTWTTTNETGELPFVIQQKRWNKWIRVGQVMGKGTPGEHTYSFQVMPHSGENTFRVMQMDMTNRPRVSESLTYTDPSIPPVSWSYDKGQRVIHLSHGSLYEIYDRFGNIVKRGYSTDIQVQDLFNGEYYLNYDNQMGESFVKR